MATDEVMFIRKTGSTSVVTFCIEASEVCQVGEGAFPRVSKLPSFREALKMMTSEALLPHCST